MVPEGLSEAQVGLVNINLGRSSDPELERQILEDIGSYGRQLGRLGDALRVLIRHVPLDDLTIDEQDAIASCLSQLDAVDRLKRKRGRARRRPADDPDDARDSGAVPHRGSREPSARPLTCVPLAPARDREGD